MDPGIWARRKSSLLRVASPRGWFLAKVAAGDHLGNAASLVSPEVIKPIVLESQEGNPNTLLTLFAESSALFKISLDAWDFSFTTFLQGNDDAKSFAWIGIQGQPAGAP